MYAHQCLGVWVHVCVHACVHEYGEHACMIMRMSEINLVCHSSGTVHLGFGDRNTPRCRTLQVV